MKKLLVTAGLFGIVINSSLTTLGCRIITTPGEDVGSMSVEKRIERIKNLVMTQKSLEDVIDSLKNTEPAAAGYNWWTKRNEVLIEIYKFDKGENLVQGVTGMKREEVIQNVKNDKAKETLEEFGLDEVNTNLINQRIKRYWNLL